MVISREAAAWYLAALIDGEGSVVKRAPAKGTNAGPRVERGGSPRNRSPRMCKITNCTPEILDAAERCCDVLGITWRRVSIGTTRIGTPIWNLEIRNRANFLLLANLPIQHPEKRSRVANGCIDRTLEVPVSRDGLRRLYWQAGFTAEQIARQFGRTPTAVGRWFGILGVEKRSMSDQARRRWAH